MKGYIQDDKNTFRVPRQEVTVGRKFFVLRGVKGAFGNFYNRFTTFERCSDMMKIK